MSNNAPDYNDNLAFPPVELIPPASDIAEIRKKYEDFIELIEILIWSDDNIVPDKIETLKNIIREFRESKNG